MTKEDKQIIDRAVKEEWRIGDRTRLKHLLEKNLKLYRENEELIQENEEMKKGLGCETCQIHLEYMRLNDKIRELGKENAELKERLAEVNLNGNIVLRELTQAKELLKKMYYLYFNPCVTNKDLENRDKLFEEIKQFLKDIEK